MPDFIDTPEPTDTLVVQTAFLGDVLLGIPLLKVLRARTKGRLVLVCRHDVGRFFLESGLVDETIEINKSHRSSWREARARLANREFALLVCPHQSFRTAIFVSQIHASLKIGYSRFFNFFAFDQRVRRPLEVPEALRQLALLGPVDETWSTKIKDFAKTQAAHGGQGENGQLTELPFGTDMKVPALMEIRNQKKIGGDVQVASVVEPFADSRDAIIVLAPGSVWRTKMWTKDGFIETGRELSRKRGAMTVVMGSKDEHSLCEEIALAIPNAVSLAGRTSLYESAQLLAIADLLICNDSGAMHLGAAAGVPIVSIFGPTVLEFGYRPWSNTSSVVQRSLGCRPCGSHGPQKCPLGHHNCMKLIKAADVLAAVPKQ